MYRKNGGALVTFTHLQVRSGYSMMNSTVKIEQLVLQAKKNNMRAVALTDENVMHGAITFYRECVKQGIKPIIGMIVSIAETETEIINAIVLAKNNQGYQQLLQLSTYIQTETEGQIDKNHFVTFCKELVLVLPIETTVLQKLCTNNDQEGLHAYLQTWKDAGFNDTIHLGVKRTEQQYVPFLVQAELELVAIGDVRYLHDTEYDAYQCLRAMDKKDSWKSKEEDIEKNPCNYFFDAKEAQLAFAEHPNLMEKANQLGDLCNVELTLNQSRLPRYPLSEGEKADAYLRERCLEALPVKYPNSSNAVVERLDYELSIIDSMQFSDYFLIVWDFIRYAKEQGILVGPGRGSAAGSLVAYLLGITAVDPIKYNLLFERFLNPERVSMPDIDIDFSDHRRDQVISYVKDKYGSEHVAQIGTFGTFQTRSVLRELAKVMEISTEDLTFILNEINQQSSKSVMDSVKASAKLLEYVKQSSKLQQLFKVAKILEGLPRHLSTHAAGVVISEQKLVDSVALINGQQDVRLTQMAMGDVEAVGLLKIDFLGLRNLTTIERILQSIKRDKNQEIQLDKLPLNDQATFSLLQKGKTNGVFQLESQGMKRVLTELKPNSFEDIVAVNALYRPGPLAFIDTYIKRKHKKENVSYIHPDLASILSTTYGVLVYQEQIIQIANQIAGFSLGQADVLRRIVSKKKTSDMETVRDQFMKGCKVNGYQENVAEEIFSWVVRFSDYGFNRSHAVAYSLIAYQLAYLKAHYPAYFLTELLNAVVGQKEKMQAYIREARDRGISLLPPSINYSYGRFYVDKQNIRMGLWSIKGIGQPVVKELLQVRKQGRFKDLFDFCLRVNLKVVNRSAIELLILSGAFDETNVDRATLLATLDQAMEQGELFGDFEDQESLFGNDLHLDGSYQNVEPFTVLQQLAYEKEILGMYVSNHPLANVRMSLRSSGYLSIAQLRSVLGRNKQKTVLAVEEIKVIRTKRGDQMAFLTLIDEEDELDAVLFPDLFREVKTWLKEESLVRIVGKTEERQQSVQLVINEMESFDIENYSPEEQRQRLFIRITDSRSKGEFLQELKEIANKYPGDTPIFIYQVEKKQTYQLANDYNLQITRECLNKLYQLFERENVVVKKV